MSHAEVVEGPAPEAIVTMAVADLGRSPALRAGGLTAEQVERLMALGGAWPPILVRRSDGAVIDGAHRVAAARRLGMVRMEVELFDGSAADAFVEFVRRNVTQGLVLSLSERKQAVVRVLRDHPRWSDRRVAELCAVSPKTVARLRSDEARCPTEEGAQSDTEVREGRDRRLRPVRRGSVRARVLEALEARPDGSLRAIAAVAGVSPETVRLVKLNLAQAPEADDAVAPADPSWREDAALEGFSAWFERTAVAEDDLAWAETLPISRVYVVADEARRRSELWLRLARGLEARPARDREP